MLDWPDEEFVRRVFSGYEVSGFPLWEVRGWSPWERPRIVREALKSAD